MVEVKHPTLRDLNEIYEIERLSFRDPYPKLVLYSHIVLHYDTSFVVKVNGKIVAYAFSAIQRIGDNTLALHVLNLAVHPDFRRKGYAKLLLRELEDLARRNGIKTMILEVSVKNRAAISLYEKMGFRIIERIEKYYFTGEDAYVMMKVLSE